MPNPSISCPKISGTVNDFSVAHPDKYGSCEPLQLRQFWNGPDLLPSETGLAYVGATEQGLSFYAYLHDSDIFSRATADDQKMWTLGDVVEVFVKPGIDRSDYWEIHVTPNDFMMDIHIPDRTQFSNGTVTWEQVVSPTSHTTKRVAAADGTWAVEICVPWRAFGLDAPPPSGSVWQFAVCRYNYNGGLENPEHSSTAHLTELNFHRYEEFTDLVFALDE